MPISARALTTLDTVKNELGITDTSKDEMLIRYINIASDYFLNAVDRKLIKGVYNSEKYRGDGSTDLYLNEYPIVSIEKIEESGSELTVDDDYELTETDKEAGSVYKNDGWDRDSRSFGILTNTYYNERLRNIEVDYTAGYCTPQQVIDTTCTVRTLPYDIEGVVIDMAVKAFKIQCTKTQGQKSYKAGTVTIQWNDILNVHENVIQLYKRKE